MKPLAHICSIYNIKPRKTTNLTYMEKNPLLQQLAERKYDEFYEFVWNQTYRNSYSESEARGDKKPYEFANEWADDTLEKVKKTYPDFNTGLGKICMERYKEYLQKKQRELDEFNSIGLEEEISPKKSFLKSIFEIILGK